MQRTITCNQAIELISKWNKGDIPEFLNTFGVKKVYSYEKVMVWLGY